MYGRSDPDIGQYDLDVLRDDLSGVLKKHQIDRRIFVPDGNCVGNNNVFPSMAVHALATHRRGLFLGTIHFRAPATVALFGTIRFRFSATIGTGA